MRLTFRLLVSLILGIAVVSFLFAIYQVHAEKRSLRDDLEKRAQTLAESLQQTVEALVEKGSLQGLQRIAEQFGNRERLAGVVIYDESKNVVAITSGLRGLLPAGLPVLDRAIMQEDTGRGEFVQIGRNSMQVYALPLHQDHKVVGALGIFYETSFIDAQSARIWRTTLQRILIQVLLIAITTLLIIRWSVARPIADTAQWLRDLRVGKTASPPPLPEEELFRPLSREVVNIARSLGEARAAAEQEARLRQAGESLWTPERLRVHVLGKLRGSRLFVVSNREPYIHAHRGNSIEVMVPASGLVTAMEPILLACDGTWIAHGSGDADAEVVDADDRLRVPPEHPQYTLRRVWLSNEEENGYYYGFSNEGLWPLCHIAHTRPVFRTADWMNYTEVNQKFAAVILKEMAATTQPFLLVQDYHFALLPHLVKANRPDARVAIFWHIPWPNPQAFGICPWQSELLEGLLGADLIGFHIQAHCNYFLETVDNALEARSDWEHFAVSYRGHRTKVTPFPISVAFGSNAPKSEPRDSPYLDKVGLFHELGVEAVFMGIGVDRVDYTKGILERLHAIERFLEKRPSYRGKFTFIQIGAPSRTRIQRYDDLLTAVEAEAERINGRFQAGRWKPIVFLKRHHSHEEIDRYYKAADLCMVTSLHDGMNLVAKEYVAACDGEQGALILSRFTGAARELRDALVVNPYDTDQLAEAIRLALEMDSEERKARMHRMRQAVREQNIYRWAANLISALSEIRLGQADPPSNGPGA